MVRELNTEEFIAEVMKSGQPSVVVFGTDTCGVCVKAKKPYYQSGKANIQNSSSISLM